MSTIEIISKIEALKEWEELSTQASEMVESIRDEIKAELQCRDIEEMNVGTYIIRWTTVTANRLDTGALRKALPDVAKNIYQSHNKSPFHHQQVRESPLHHPPR